MMVSHQRSPFCTKGRRTAKGARTEVRWIDDVAGGHVSCSDSWCTEIFVSLKGL
jgi:hypothetical protein